MSDDLDQQIEEMQADGRITVHDADEVRRFRDFLEEGGEPGSKEAFESLKKHYPEEHAKAVEEAKARKQAKDG